jgi:hypothetical protein
MTDEDKHSKIIGDTEAQEDAQHDESSKVDWFLQSLVLRANLGTSLAIVLNVGGLIIVGDLVSEKNYLDEVATPLEKRIDQAMLVAVESKFGEEGRQVIEAHIRERDEADKQQQETAHEETDISRYPQFIHLKNARFHHHNVKPIPVNQGVWWRGRLEAVDGFFIGTLQVETEHV